MNSERTLARSAGGPERFHVGCPPREDEGESLQRFWWPSQTPAATGNGKVETRKGLSHLCFSAQLREDLLLLPRVEVVDQWKELLDVAVDSISATNSKTWKAHLKTRVAGART